MDCIRRGPISDVSYIFPSFSQLIPFVLSRVTSASSGIGLFTITATERNRDEDSRDSSALYRCTVCFRMCIRYED